MRGIVVVLLGPDGCGKSTVAEQVARRLSAERPVRRHHLRPGLLPAPGRLLHPRRAPAPGDEPHGRPPSGPIGSAARLAWYLADYTVGYRLRIRPHARVQGTVVLFERYVHDLIVEPGRLRSALPPRVARGLLALVPGPDGVLLLDAPASVLHARKQELPLAELERQVRAYRALVDQTPGGRRIQADRPLEAVVDDVVAAIEEALPQ